jgi:hypothetical protein
MRGDDVEQDDRHRARHLPPADVGERAIDVERRRRTPDDHTGGTVRNNFIYRNVPGDTAIYVADSPNTQVLHNSIFISGTYPNPIEYRFAHTTGTLIANNVLGGSR